MYYPFHQTAWKTTLSRALLCLGILCSLLIDLRAETLTLEQLVARTLENHPRLQSLEFEVAAARGARLQVDRWENPELETNLGYQRVGEGSDGASFEIAWSQQFSAPGKRDTARALADHDILLTQLELESARQKLVHQVRRHALRHQSALRQASLADAASERSRALIALLRQRPQGGAKPFLEIRVLEASLNEFDEAALEASHRAQENLVALNTLTGRQPLQPLTITHDFTTTPVEFPPLNRLQELARQKAFPLRQSAALQKRTQLALEASQKERLSDYRLGPSLSHDSAGEGETVIGIQFSIDLPLWNRQEGSIARAQALQNATRWDQKSAERQLNQKIATLWQKAEATRHYLTKHGEEKRREIAAAAALADRQYRQGAIDVQLYLETQRAHLLTYQIYHRSLSELWDHTLALSYWTNTELPSTSIQTSP